MNVCPELKTSFVDKKLSHLLNYGSLDKSAFFKYHYTSINGQFISVFYSFSWLLSIWIKLAMFSNLATYGQLEPKW